LPHELRRMNSVPVWFPSQPLHQEAIHHGESGVQYSEM
jgi:hypothetical protein